MSLVTYTAAQAKRDYSQSTAAIRQAVREIEQIIAQAANDGKASVEVHSLKHNNEFVHYHLPTYTCLQMSEASAAIVDAFKAAGYRCGFVRDEGYIPASRAGECNEEQYRLHRWVLTFYWD